MKAKRILFWIIVFGLSIYLVIKIVTAFKQNAQAFDEDLPSTYSLLPEDSILISPNFLKDLKVTQVLQSKVRPPISLLTFKDKYNLIINRIGNSNASLKKMIKSSKMSIDRSVGVTYTVINNNTFSFQYSAGRPAELSEIYITIAGDIFNKIETDSLISYDVLCKNFSLRLTHNSPVDLYVKSKSNLIENKTIPLNIVFLTCNNSVYLLLLTPIDQDESLESNLLYNIIKK